MPRAKTVTPLGLIEALESGEYKPGAGRLALGKGKQRRHCCLGVACEVAGAKYSDDEDFLDMPFDPHFWGSGEDDHAGVQGVRRSTPPYWAPWLTSEVQEDLAAVNDDGIRRRQGYRFAIKRLREMIAGGVIPNR